MNHKIKYGSKDILLSILFSDRKTLGITVNPDKSVVVRAPKKALLSEVLQRVEKRGHWILQQQRSFEAFPFKAQVKKFVSGETHYYLGRQYRLKVVDDDREEVKLKGRYIYLRTKKTHDTAQKLILLEEWYRAHAEIKMTELLSSNLDLFKRYSLSPPILRFRKMQKRWGSCTSQGRLYINPSLVKAPVRCIEYVIIHELCHLIAYDHNKKFYGLLDKTMPDWKKWKERLEHFG